MEHLAADNETLRMSVAYIVAKAIGIAFTYAVVAKMMNIEALSVAIRRWSIVPVGVSTYLIAMLIACEVVIALSHLTGIGLSAVIPATLAMLSGFLIMTAGVLLRGDERPCLCFGANTSEQIDVYSLVRICLLMGGELVLWRNFQEYSAMGVAEGSVLNRLNMFVVSAVGVSLTSWIFAAPKLWKSLRVIDR